jgi:hypothetical protein
MILNTERNYSYEKGTTLPLVHIGNKLKVHCILNNLIVNVLCIIPFCVLFSSNVWQIWTNISFFNYVKPPVDVLITIAIKVVGE